MIKTPFLAVDGIIKLYDQNENFRGIILIERLNKPFGIAIPGGFVDIGETVEHLIALKIGDEIIPINPSEIQKQILDIL